MPRLLTKEEKEAIYVALGIGKNIVETGYPNLSAVDVQNVGAEAAKKEYGVEIQPLSTSQMEVIILRSNW
jgi:hypothetical protein